MGLSLKELNTALRAKGGYDIAGATTLYQDMNDIEALIDDMNAFRGNSAYSGDRDLEGYDTAEGAMSTCTCNTRTAVGCNCDSRTSCVCNARDSSCYCNARTCSDCACNVRGSCNCDSRSACICVSRTWYDAHGCSQTCRTHCHCNARSCGDCYCDVRDSCHCASRSICNCNSRTAACHCNSRTACSCDLRTTELADTFA